MKINNKPPVKIKDNIKYHNDFDQAFKFVKRTEQTETETKTKTKTSTVVQKTNPYTNKDAPWVNNISKLLFDSAFLPEVDKFRFQDNNIGIKIKPCNFNINTSIYHIDNKNISDTLKNNKISYLPIINKTRQEEIQEFEEKREKGIQKITNNNKFSEQQKYVKIKDLNEKINKGIKMIGKIIVSHRYKILFNEEQKKIILNWMKICDHFYNYCVSSYNKGDNRFNKNSKGIKAQLFNYYFKHILLKTNKEVIDNDIELENLKKVQNIISKKKGKRKAKNNNNNNKEDTEIISKNIKYKIFNLVNDQETFSNEINIVSNEDKVLKKISKAVPYDTITDELMKFCNNLKSCYTNLENKHIEHFEMNIRDYKRNYRSILLPKKSINKKGIFTKILGKMGGNYNRAILNLLEEDKIHSDCRLTYDRIFDEFTIIIPMIKDKIILENREKFAALDPGEKIFQAFFGEKSCGIIGENVRELIISLRTKIDKIKSILAGGINRKKKKLKRRKLLRKRMYKLEKRMSNIIDDIHKKSSLFLCKNYEKVLIPEFHTQDMVSMRKLGRKVNYSILRLKHYKFKQHLKMKGQQYGCKIYEVTEEYTSQCCGKCGKVTKVYDERVKTCTVCKTKIDRDLNGSRNIFIKNYDCILDVSKVEEASSKIEELKDVKKLKTSRRKQKV